MVIMSDKIKDIGQSGFLIHPGIEYFKFEEDFVEENIRCIPMAVRIKLDACGIKLQLTEWSKFKPGERTQLATQSCGSNDEIASYRKYLEELVLKRTGSTVINLPVDEHPAWAALNSIDAKLQEKAKESGWWISPEQWKCLTNLQRFALLKLCRQGHESSNFPKAMKEFGLVK